MSCFPPTVRDLFDPCNQAHFDILQIACSENKNMGPGADGAPLSYQANHAQKFPQFRFDTRRPLNFLISYAMGEFVRADSALVIFWPTPFELGKASASIRPQILATVQVPQ